MKRSEKLKGFTLIEVLIVVLILGILVSIAYPSYVNSVRKSNRAEAKTELFDVAQRLQRCYTAYSKFNDATNCRVYQQLVGTPTLKTQGNKFYEITFAASPAVSATTYTLVATAVKVPQTKDTKDGCNVLTLNQSGVRGPAACW